MSNRRLMRSTIIRRVRRLTRAHVRSSRPEPDPLREMLTCYRQAIRAYRRLARLAPYHYDPAVIDREQRRRAEERRWLASWEPALDKAYGPPTPAEREAQRQADLLREQPPRLHPNTQRAVNREQAKYDLWKACGRLASARYEAFKQRRPHDLPSLGRVAQLLEIALDFSWIATGLDWRNPQPEPPPAPSFEQEFEAAMRRAYGPNPPSPTPSRYIAELRPSPESLGSSSSNQATHNAIPSPRGSGPG